MVSVVRLRGDEGRETIHPIGTGFANEMPSREKKRIGPRQKRDAEAKPS